MRYKNYMMIGLCAIVLEGCYSSARHIANVRTDVIKPDITLAVKYRLERIVLKKAPYDTHYADTQMVFNSVRSALLKSYPSVFTDSADATPIALVIDCSTEYKPLPNYASILADWFWPSVVEQESKYHLYLFENPFGKTDDEIWNAYLTVPKKYPLPQECGSAVRMSEMWTSYLLPTGFIPCPGESDFPKTFYFMRQDIDFESMVDGDVLAAAVMRIVNRKHRTQEAKRTLEGGTR